MTIGVPIPIMCSGENTVIGNIVLSEDDKQIVLTPAVIWATFVPVSKEYALKWLSRVPKNGSSFLCPRCYSPLSIQIVEGETQKQRAERESAHTKMMATVGRNSEIKTAKGHSYRVVGSKHLASAFGDRDQRLITFGMKIGVSQQGI